MNELLNAAKAVIKELDEKDTWVLTVDNEDSLRAAVERAEKPRYPPCESCAYVGGYKAGVQAERERIKGVISTHVGAEVSELLEMIDERID